MPVFEVLSKKEEREKRALHDGSESDLEAVDVSAPVYDKNAKEDAVWGTSDDKGPNFTNMGWKGASVVQAKAQIGLGVLGIPQVMATLGLVPAILLIFLVAIMSTSAMFIIGKFKLRHPNVHSISDVGMLWWGPIGREGLGFVYLLYMVMSAGSGLLSISIAFNAMSQHAICTVIFVVVSTIIVALLSSIQTLEKVAILGWTGLISVIVAIVTLTVAVGIDGPSGAPPGADLGIQNVGSPTFAQASSAVGTIVFAFGATPAFFNVVAEMRNPKDYWKSALVGQILATTLYIIIGSVVYEFAGNYVASPALGTAGPLLVRICYGLAFPSLVASSTLFTHFSAKYIFVRILRGSRHISANTPIHWISWIGSVLAAAISAFLIADGIPVFNGLISLVGSLLGAPIGLMVMGGMWLSDNLPLRHGPEAKTWTYRLCGIWAMYLIVGGAFITVAGSYGAISGIVDDYAISPGASFSCADNSV
ncbi:hypothetical protein P7C70_g3266, partial [Phenoliferia sp. Uapishka_3]